MDVAGVDPVPRRSLDVHVGLEDDVLPVPTLGVEFVSVALRHFRQFTFAGPQAVLDPVGILVPGGNREDRDTLVESHAGGCLGGAIALFGSSKGGEFGSTARGRRRCRRRSFFVVASVSLIVVESDRDWNRIAQDGGWMIPERWRTHRVVLRCVLEISQTIQ